MKGTTARGEGAAVSARGMLRSLVSCMEQGVLL